MKCPNCNVALVMADRNGIEIDYCPECRGIWLDRGELDKVIDRSSQQNSNSKGYFGKDHYHQPRYNKKKGFLSDLFDF